MNSLEDLLQDQLKDLYSAEQQLTKALPRMARGANAPELKAAIQKHLQETERQVERLDQIATQLEIALRGKKCAAMEGLIEEGKEILEEDGDENVLDAGIIAAAQKVEHYEISAYGSARAIAEKLGLTKVAQLLQATLDEESQTDEKLTQLSEEIVLPACQKSEDEDGSDGQKPNGRQRSAGTHMRAGGRSR